jgi:hypothetical protein
MALDIATKPSGPYALKPLMIFFIALFDRSATFIIFFLGEPLSSIIMTDTADPSL